MESHGAATPTTFTFASPAGWHYQDEATQHVHVRALALQSKQRAERLTRETTALLSQLDASQAERLEKRKIARQQRRDAQRVSGAADRDALIQLRREHQSRAGEQHSIDLRKRSDQMMPSQSQCIDLRQEPSDDSPETVAKRERDALIDLRVRHGKSTDGGANVSRWG